MRTLLVSAVALMSLSSVALAEDLSILGGANADALTATEMSTIQGATLFPCWFCGGGTTTTTNVGISQDQDATQTGGFLSQQNQNQQQSAAVSTGSGDAESENNNETEQTQTTTVAVVVGDTNNCQGNCAPNPNQGGGALRNRLRSLR